MLVTDNWCHYCYCYFQDENKEEECYIKPQYDWHMSNLTSGLKFFPCSFSTTIYLKFKTFHKVFMLTFDEAKQSFHSAYNLALNILDSRTLASPFDAFPHSSVVACPTLSTNLANGYLCLKTQLLYSEVVWMQLTEITL